MMLLNKYNPTTHKRVFFALVLCIGLAVFSATDVHAGRGDIAGEGTIVRSFSICHVDTNEKHLVFFSIPIENARFAKTALLKKMAWEVLLKDGTLDSAYGNYTFVEATD